MLLITIYAIFTETRPFKCIFWSQNCWEKIK